MRKCHVASNDNQRPVRHTIGQRASVLAGEGWPSALPGHVFLGEAVKMTGAAMFPGAWTGIEPATSRPFRMDRTLSTMTPQRDIERASFILWQHHETYRQRCPIALMLSKRAMPTAEEWECALVHADREDASSESAFRRFWAVCVLLRSYFFDGRIATSTRPHRGGDFKLT